MINESLFRNVLKEIKENPEYALDVIDSFSDNQFLTKTKLLNYVESINILDNTSDVVLFGSWYGSILIPGLVNKVNQITCIDLDERVLKVAKNRFFTEYSNIEYVYGDVFEKDLKRYHSTKLFINTSCEHMLPMSQWPFWKYLDHTFYFAFTSNDMYNIEGHINCVSSIEEFKGQLPEGSTVLIEDTIADSRGKRFLIVGKIN